MAKKLNSSGQLQEYVPAGNGDASGEYADSGGSNRHFATFGKPQNPEAISGNQKGSAKEETVKKENQEENKKENKKEIDEKNQQILNSIQTDLDKKIEKMFTNGCAVCLGKSINKDVAAQVENVIKNVNNDFEDMSGFITAIGARNELEKYLNAVNFVPPTEEEIQKEIKRLKAYNLFTSFDESVYREKAIKNLTAPIKIKKVNSAVAYWSPSKKRLVFMNKMKNYDDSKTKEAFDKNWWSSDKGIGVVYHEYGHAVHSMIRNLESKIERNKSRFAIIDKRDEFDLSIRELRWKNVNTNYEKELEKRLVAKYGYGMGMDSFNSSYMNKKRMAENEIKEQLKKEGIKKYNISQYGDTDKDEFVAECFAAYYTGMNNPLANEVVETYKKYYKDLKEIEKG